MSNGKYTVVTTRLLYTPSMRMLVCWAYWLAWFLRPQTSPPYPEKVEILMISVVCDLIKPAVRFSHYLLLHTWAVNYEAYREGSPVLSQFLVWGVPSLTHRAYIKCCHGDAVHFLWTTIWITDILSWSSGSPEDMRSVLAVDPGLNCSSQQFTIWTNSQEHSVLFPF